MIEKILIATTNKGKHEEIADLLKALPCRLITPDQIQLDIDIEENGKTYLENAHLKALAYCQASQLPTLADDSGLEVAALGGQPGLYSARFSGSHNASDHERRQFLLSKLKNHARPWEARFVCAVVLALPSGKVFSYEDSCSGEIIPEERGSHGFGYDPIFFFPQLKLTMAELNMEEKNHISHRAKAVQGIIPVLKNF